MDNILLSIVYGIIQGVAEFLPISSSGHLALAHSLFGIDSPDASNLTLDILLHLGTLVAVFIIYWKDIIALIPAFFTMLGKVFKRKFKLSEYTLDERFAIFIIIATLPLVLAVFFKDYVEALSNYPKIIGGILIFNGIVLLISDRISKGTKDISKTKPRNALAVGLFQMIAIVPGLSRSGSTITGGLLQGFNREYAVKFSFIMSIPAILGANILNIKDVFNTSATSTDYIAYIVGMITAAVFGILAIKLLIYISKKSTFTYFSYYCFAVGLIAIIFA